MRQRRVLVRPTSVRMRVRLALTVVVAFAAGCSADAPRPVETPDVRWDGAAPSGSIEQDPWVKAVRAGELALAAATNSANYTDRALLDTWREEHVHRVAERGARRLDDGSSYVLLGPSPFAPLAVEVEPSKDRAVVRGCADAAATEPEVDMGPGPWPQAFEFRLERSPDGQRRIRGASGLQEPFMLPSGQSLTDEYCASIEIPRGTFDPAPDVEAFRQLRASDVLLPPTPSPTSAGK